MGGNQPMQTSENRDRGPAQSFGVWKPETKLAAFGTAQVKSRRPRDLLAVDRQTECTPLLDHRGATRWTRFVSHGAQGPLGERFLFSRFLHEAHPRLHETKSGRNWSGESP